VAETSASTSPWRLAIQHETMVEYDGTARASYNELRMTPLSTAGQTTLNHYVELHPRAPLWEYTDYWGTRVTAFDLQEPHSTLTIRAASTVETTGPQQAHAPDARGAGRTSCDWPTVTRAATSAALAEFTARTERTTITPELVRLARQHTRGTDPREAADALAAWVHESVAYVPGATGVHTNAQESWDQGEGVCQDFSHLTVALMRAIGLPARYVSGYLFPDPQAAPGTATEGQSHAWVEYWADGWHGIDATNRTVPGLRHVAVGHGRDYADVLPHKGIYHGAPGSSLKVSVRFTRLV
jgi:transglutaminase-like putative cysteine protease